MTASLLLLGVAKPPGRFCGFHSAAFFWFFGKFGGGAFVRQVNFDTGWGTEVLKGRREVGTKPKWLERFLSAKD